MDFPPRPSRPTRPGRPSRSSRGERAGLPARSLDEPFAARRVGRPGTEPEIRISSRRSRRGSAAGRSGGAKKPQRQRSETLLRVAVAIPASVAAVIVIDIGGIVFALAMGGLAVVGVVELFRIAAQANPLTWVAAIVSVAMSIAAYFGGPSQILICAVVAFPVMFGFAAARPERRGISVAMAFTVFAVIWIGLPFAHAVLLRELPVHGSALLFDVLVCTFATDTFAYFGGRLFGRHKLAPSISPSKTIEGLVIGVVFGALSFWFAGLYQDWLGGLAALVMGLVVAALAPVGDLFSSMLKRDLDVKDTGTLFGPHGGLLDRCDAVMFTVVAGYYLAGAYGF